MPKQYPFNTIDLATDYNLQIPFLDIFTQIRNKNLSNFYKNTGIGSTYRPVNIPIPEIAETESLYGGEKSNAFIIFGNDRPAGLQSGYGGEGHTGAGAIDIVAGIASTKPVAKAETNICLTNKSFLGDASRVYISQKADIDKYLNLQSRDVRGALGKNIRLDNSNGKAAIALITDCIRLSARESVKITTTHLGQNSNENDVDISGIDLIAGHDVDDQRHSLQPMVKGNNLVDCFVKLFEIIENLQATLINFAENQEKVNSLLINHKHVTGAAGSVSDAIISKESINDFNKTIIKTTTEQIIGAKHEIGKTIIKYLRPNGTTFINSFYNRVN